MEVGVMIFRMDIPYGTIHRVASSGKAKGKAENDVGNLNIIATYNVVHGSPISFVQYGLGHFLTTRDLLAPTLDFDICFLPLKPKLTTELALVWKKHAMLSKAAKTFMKIINKNL